MKPVGRAKIPRSVKCFLQNFSDEHWLHHPVNVKKSNFNFYIYIFFKDNICVLIVKIQF